MGLQDFARFYRLLFRLDYESHLTAFFEIEHNCCEIKEEPENKNLQLYATALYKTVKLIKLKLIYKII